jgi:hypothetical protein
MQIQEPTTDGEEHQNMEYPEHGRRYLRSGEDGQ